MFTRVCVYLPSLLDYGLFEGRGCFLLIFTAQELNHKLIVMLNWTAGNVVALNTHPTFLVINQFFIPQLFIENPEYQNLEHLQNELIRYARMGTFRLL